MSTNPWATSIRRRRAALKTISRCCAQCASCYPSRSNLLSCSPLCCKGAIFFIPFIRYSEMNPSNYHSTCAQMTPKHKNDRHTDLNIDSPFPALLPLHSPLLLSPTPPPSWKCAAIPNQIVTSSLAGQGKEEEEKQWKIMIFLSSSRGLSYTIYFNIPSHKLLYLKILCRGHKKACTVVRMWWQVSVQTLNINGVERVRPRCTHIIILCT